MWGGIVTIIVLYVSSGGEAQLKCEEYLKSLDSEGNITIVEWVHTFFFILNWA